MNTSDSEKFFYTDYNISLAVYYEKALEHYHKQDFLATAFMLQQAVVFTYLTLIKTVGGSIHKYTHIKQIKEYLLTFLPEFENSFPSNTNQDYVLLKQLDKIHPDFQYSSDFTITEEEILQLLERVGDLQDLAKEVFLQKMSV